MDSLLNSDGFVVCVVHYNDQLAVENLLLRIRSWSISPRMIFVVDNSGNFKPPSKVSPGLSTAIILDPGGNVGYAEAVNLALRHAIADGDKYLLALTQDAWLRRDCAEILLTSLGRNADVGLAAPVLAFASEPDIVFSAGGYLQLRGGFNHRRAYESIDSIPRGVIENIEWADGAVTMIRVQTAEQVGLIPSEYFLYVEDVDFGFTLRSAGWRLIVNTGAIAYQQPGNFTPYLRSRNVLYFRLKHRQAFGLGVAFRTAAGEIRAGVRSGRVRPFLWSLRGLSDAILKRMGRPPATPISRRPTPDFVKT